jgi:cystathionine beta-lyase family protein involved in aluminum resistance
MEINTFLKQEFQIKDKTIELVDACEALVRPVFSRCERVAQINQLKVLRAFRNNQVSPRHFYPSTGYGYGDEGREALARVFADAFSAEAAIVSPMIMSGTHALHMALFGLLHPGDAVLSVTGKPYDTLHGALRGRWGSLSSYHIDFLETPLSATNGIDVAAALRMLRANGAIKIIYIQRSTGYDVRTAFTSARIGAAIAALRAEFPRLTFVVDNCYGEFVDDTEPTEHGADLIAGSLIKNPGGGLAPTGGYILGREALIEKIADRFSAPGIGTEIGSYAYGYQPFFQGLFMAPHTVLQALKGVVLAATVFERLGYTTSPNWDEERGDITQTITFGTEAPLTAFVRAIQRVSAVDGHVTPYAWDMPGYEDQVIMAAGTFVQGASLELTADAPMREPYCAYLQGALTYEHAKTAVLYAADELLRTAGE